MACEHGSYAGILVCLRIARVRWFGYTKMAEDHSDMLIIPTRLRVCWCILDSTYLKLMIGTLARSGWVPKGCSYVT